MLKKLINEARFRLIIKTTGPLLIKSGTATVLGPDMAPVLTYRNGQPEVFLPGSSLKGVFRSHLEKIICSIKPQVVCDPFWRPTEDHKESEQKVVPNLEIRSRDNCISCGDEFRRWQNEFEEKQKKRWHDGVSPLDESENPAARTDMIYSHSCPTC